MKIVYHHYKDLELEKQDIRNRWWTCPPELIVTPEEDKKLLKWWHFFNGKNAYIVDPLGATQCNYAILMEIPKWFRFFFFRNIDKEHVYDVEEDDR
jgi:hypothetical protein